MQSIKLKNLRPGMVVAQEVKGLNGRVLLAVDQEISKKHLKIFKVWGINQVNIKDQRSRKKSISKEKRKDPQKIAFAAEVPSQLLEKAERECKELFRFNQLEDPIVHELYRMAVGYTIKGEPTMEDFDVF